MKPSSHRVSSLIAGSLFASGCFDGGDALSVAPIEGPAVFVLVRDGAIAQRFDLEAATSSLPIVKDPSTRGYLIRVGVEQVRARHRALAAERLSELRIVDAPAELHECPQGVLAPGSGPSSVDHDLREVSELFELRDRELVSSEVWPVALEALALRIPVQPCRAVEATVRPFAASSPFVEVDGQLGVIELAAVPGLGLTDLAAVGYVGPDLALIGLPRTLMLIGRDESLLEARLIDFVDSGRALLNEPGIDSLFMQFVRRPTVDPNAPAVFVVLLGHGDAETGEDAGFSVVELPIEGPDFGTPRLLHRARSGRERAGSLAVGSGDEFTLTQRDVVLHYSRGTLESIESTRDRELEAAVLSADAQPKLVLATRPAGWFEAETVSLGALEWRAAPRGDPNVDLCDELLWTSGREPPRLFSGCSHPAIFERADQGWIERPLWFSEDLGTCNSASRRCGRLEPQLRAELETFVEAPAERLAYLMRGCAAVLLKDLDGATCDGHVEVDVEAYTHRSDVVRLRRLDRLGHRILLGGDGALLLEVELH